MLYGFWLRSSGAVRAAAARAVLLAVYYAVLTPAAALYRLFSGDPLNLSGRTSGGSYFTRREGAFTAADLEKMW
jgi:hypothetical protein